MMKSLDKAKKVLQKMKSRKYIQIHYIQTKTKKKRENDVFVVVLDTALSIDLLLRV